MSKLALFIVFDLINHLYKEFRNTLDGKISALDAFEDLV